MSLLPDIADHDAVTLKKKVSDKDELRLVYDDIDVIFPK